MNSPQLQSPLKPGSPASYGTSPSSPVVSLSMTPGTSRRIAIAVDLSEESAHAVRWAVQNYLRPGDSVILLHVRPTSALYGADWGSIQLKLSGPNPSATAEQNQQKLEDDFDNFTTSKTADLAQPLVEAQIPFKIHIVKDHDLKERLCLEVERLGICAVIMGSRGFGASRRTGLGRLGSVSDYCVNHCVCPVVVVRYPDEKGGEGTEPVATLAKIKTVVAEEAELHPVPEEEQEYHDASDEQKGDD